jgi:hypothetical protein
MLIPSGYPEASLFYRAHEWGCGTRYHHGNALAPSPSTGLPARAVLERAVERQAYPDNVKVYVRLKNE